MPNWSTTEQEAVTAGVKVMVYGDAGMGKTVLCATCPRPLIISNESGLLSLAKANLERVFGVNAPGITYTPIPVMKIVTEQDLLEAFKFCKSDKYMENFDTVCLDSVSEMAETILNTQKRVEKDGRKAYGETNERMEWILRSFRDLPGKNVYFSAKMSPIKDEITGGIKYGIAMPGQQLTPKMPYFFDEMFFINRGVEQTTGKSFVYLQTQADMQHGAKDRSGALALTEYPHLGNIFAKITGANK